MELVNARRHERTKAATPLCPPLKRGEAKRRRGIAAVEFALVASLLFVLVIGIIDYGFIFLKAQQITQAARSGVRAAVLPDATAAKVTTAISTIMNDAGIAT